MLLAGLWPKATTTNTSVASNSGPPKLGNRSLDLGFRKPRQACNTFTFGGAETLPPLRMSGRMSTRSPETSAYARTQPGAAAHVFFRPSQSAKGRRSRKQPLGVHGPRSYDAAGVDPHRAQFARPGPTDRNTTRSRHTRNPTTPLLPQRTPEAAEPTVNNRASARPSRGTPAPPPCFARHPNGTMAQETQLFSSLRATLPAASGLFGAASHDDIACSGIKDIAATGPTTGQPLGAQIPATRSRQFGRFWGTQWVCRKRMACQPPEIFGGGGWGIRVG